MTRRFRDVPFRALLVVLPLLLGLVSVASAAASTSPPAASDPRSYEARVARTRAARITQPQREAAAERARLMRAVGTVTGASGVRAASGYATPTPGGVPDYFGTTPNWAFSPQLRKFVDTLPGLGPDKANNLGQYLSVAKPDTITYPGSDYYEIEVRQFSEKMHSDLPPTTLRGYVQVNKGTDNTGHNTLVPDPIRYLGPTIVARRDRPVRIKFTNKLPTGAGGDLFIPVDTTVMGAGQGPAGDFYKQNRATLHLHGGLTPWISDGTPHQWVTPAGENTPYPKGVSVKNVPDMPDPGPGSMTFFYTNAQSARMMFYHDHSYGITRLNVYAGEAAGYLIQDPIEDRLVASGTIPAEQIPLIIQDKTFVDSATIRVTDPTWNWGTGSLDPTTGIRTPASGDLWVSHVYMPAQNPADPGGMNPMGRWHYGPWFWPPLRNLAHPPIANPYYRGSDTPWEPPLMPATPNPSMGMEQFNDTPLVNGTIYPVLDVQPKAYRFRVLNAANDRFFNLQMYEANNTKAVDRLGGASRYDVSVASALRAYPRWTGVTDVVVSSGEDRARPDVLSAAGLAGAYDAPLMLVPYGTINPALASAIKAMPSGVRVHIVGGPGSVSAKVARQLAALPTVSSVDRIDGIDRYAVAGNVGRRMKSVLGSAFPHTVLIANGNVPAALFDALAASAIAFRQHYPILLVKNYGVPATTWKALADLELDRRYIIGGTSFVNAASQAALGVAPGDRIAGADRFSTAAAIASRAVAEGWLTRTRYGVASAFPDAATGGAFMGKQGGALLYSWPTGLQGSTNARLTADKDHVTGAFVFGGPASISAGVVDRIRQAIQLAIKSEVAMVPAEVTPGYPATWPTDGRVGGAPDPATAGPQWIQIGNEGGFLPKPAIIAQQPVTWNGDPTTFNYGNVQDHSLLLGCAERADVIVDFSKYAGKTLILYNDAPAAFPAPDARVDYFTGAPDMTDTGGAATPRIGFGPNTRTIMQIRVAATAPAAAYDVARLNAAFASTATTQGAFAASQNPIIIPDARYGSAYGTTTFAVDPYVRIYQNEATFGTLDSRTVTIPLSPKGIHDEMGAAFDPEYGRMSGKLGVELPQTQVGGQNFILYGFIDPPTEQLKDSMTPLSPVGADGTQIWKITHNGVDTHPIHFHLFDVQLINRVGWDGAIRPPDDNELGWKETVRISPLEDTIVALKPVAPKTPFGLPDSWRPLDPTQPVDGTMGFANLDPLTGAPITPGVKNKMTNFGWEYVWHCHILSHEEMDMMRPIKLEVARSLPATPVLTATGAPGAAVTLAWTDGTPPSNPLAWGDPGGEIGYRIERATVTSGVESAYDVLGSALANGTSFEDTTTLAGTTYRYRVYAFNASGEVASDPFDVAPVP